MTNRVRKHKVEEAVKVDRIHFKRNEKEKKGSAKVIEKSGKTTVMKLPIRNM